MQDFSIFNNSLLVSVLLNIMESLTECEMQNWKFYFEAILPNTMAHQSLFGPGDKCQSLRKEGIQRIQFCTQYFKIQK